MNIEKLNLVKHYRGHPKYNNLTLTHEGFLLVIHYLLKYKQMEKDETLFCKTNKKTKRFNLSQKKTIMKLKLKYIHPNEIVTVKVKKGFAK